MDQLNLDLEPLDPVPHSQEMYRQVKVLVDDGIDFHFRDGTGLALCGTSSKFVVIPYLVARGEYAACKRCTTITNSLMQGWKGDT